MAQRTRLRKWIQERTVPITLKFHVNVRLKPFISKQSILAAITPLKNRKFKQTIAADKSIVTFHATPIIHGWLLRWNYRSQVT